MNLEDAIMVIPNTQNDLLYDRLVDYADNIEMKKATISGDPNFIEGKVDEDIRNVSEHALCNTDKKTDKVLLNHIEDHIRTFFINYKAKFKNVHVKRITEANILKYGIGGKYEWHHDEYSDSSGRTLTMILNLNSDYEGGAFEFAGPDKKTFKTVECKKGTSIIFPSNFLFMHRVTPITKGTRYSIVLWLH